MNIDQRNRIRSIFGKDEEEEQIQPHKTTYNRSTGMMTKEVRVPSKFYSGSQPTGRETLARIYEISQEDEEEGSRLYGEYQRYSNDPSTPIYNPYSTATSKSVEALGYDPTEGIGSTFFAENAELMNYYRTSETGTSPLAPTKSSSAQQNAAYWYYKAMEDAETTESAESELSELTHELTYWAKRSDRNYSDEEILQKLDWKKYPTLQKMDEGRLKGVPVSMIRPVEYSEDAIYGILWAARNGGASSGNTTNDAVRGVLGHGNAYKRDAEISAKLDPSSEQYSPYSLGSTLDDAALYFDTAQFGSDWLEKNRSILSSNDPEAVKNYNKVYNAEKTTLAAEAELLDLNAEIDEWLALTSDPQAVLDGLLDSCPTLARMDESLKSGNILETTRAIDYRWADIEKTVQERCDQANNAVQGDAYAQDVTQNLGYDTKKPSNTAAINTARDEAINAAGQDIMQSGTEEEKAVFQTAYSADFHTYLQEINTAITTGTLDGQGSYDHCLSRANSYTAENYMNAKAVITPYNEVQSEVEAATEKRDALIADQSADRASSVDDETAARISALEQFIADGGKDKSVLLQPENGVGAVAPKQPIGSVDIDPAIAMQLAQEELARLQSGGTVRPTLQSKETVDAKREHSSEIAALDDQIASGESYLLSHQSEYEKAQAQYTDMQEGYSIASRVAALTEAEEVQENPLVGVMDFIYLFGEGTPATRSAQTGYDLALYEGSSREAVASAAKLGMIANNEEMQWIDYALAQIDTQKINVDQSYIDNMHARKTELENDNQAAAYFLLTEEGDFDSIVAETKKKAGDAWGKTSVYSFTPTIVDRYGYSQMDASAADPMHGMGSNLIPAMTDDERDTYLYLLGTKGADAAKGYYDYMTDYLSVRTAEGAKEFYEQLADEHPLGATALTVIASPLQMAGSVYAMGTKLFGNEVDPFNSAFGITSMSGTVRGTVKENINSELGEGTALAQIANVLYDAGTSGADSMVSGLLGGGSAVASVSLMGMQASSSAIMDAKLRGASDTQALLMGAATFVAESVTEYIPMEKMFGAFTSGQVKEVRKFLGELSVSALSEGIGEGINSILETKSDDWIMGKLSNRETSITQYMQDGMTREEAEAEAIQDVIGDMFYSAIVGSVSGGMSTGTAYAAGRLTGSGSQTTVETENSADSAVATEGVEVEGETEASENLDDTVGVEDTADALESEPEATDATSTELAEPAAHETATEESASDEVAIEDMKEVAADSAVVGRQVGALTQALSTADQSSQTATIAAVLGTGQTDADALSIVSAAAQHMSLEHGSVETVKLVREAVLLTAENNIPQDGLMSSIAVASLTYGQSNQALTSLFENGVTIEGLNSLISTAEVESENQEVQSVLRTAVQENQIATRVKEIVSDGALKGIDSYSTAVDQARSNLREANSGLKQAEARQSALGQNLHAIQGQFMESPTNPAFRGAYQQAIKDVEGSAIVVQQMQQSVAKYNGQLQTAESMRDEARNDALKNIREQARQEVLTARAEAENARVLESQQKAQSEKMQAQDKAVHGNHGVVYTNDQTPIDFHYVIVDQQGLVASNDTNMQPNPDYPAELQPRDRTRGANAMQVSQIAHTLNPARLGGSVDVQNGAPIIGNDYVLESGNGRTLAIQSAMKSGLPTAQAYTNWLTENAETFGIDSSAVNASSILVRMRETEVDRGDFTKKSNEGTTAAFSTTENAQNDAKRLTADVLDLFVPNDNGVIDTAANGAFLTRFMNSIIPKSEQGNYRQAGGSISQNGLMRIRNAIFQKAFGNTNLTAALSESTDEGTKNILRALTNTAPRIAAISEQIKKGDLYDLNIASDLSQAAERYRIIKKNGQDVESYLAQYRMPELDEDSMTAKAFLRMFDENKRSGKAMAQAINDILSDIEKQGDPKQISLLENLEVPTLDDLVAASLEKTRAQQQSSRGDVTGNGGKINAMMGNAGVIDTPVYPHGPAKSIKSGQQIIQELAKAIGMPADSRSRKYLRRLKKATKGYTVEGSKVIHVMDAQAIDVVAHEYGHKFDEAFQLVNRPEVNDMVRSLEQSNPAFILQYETEQRPSEAIAEFVRYWMLDRGQAVDFAGRNFTENFEQKLKERGWLKPMQQAALDVRLNLGATAGEQTAACIDLEERKDKNGLRENLDGLAVKLFDYTKPLHDLTEARRKQEGASFQADKDVRTLLLGRESSISNTVTSCLYNEMVTPEGDAVLNAEGNKVGSLADILSEVPIAKEKDLNTLWALLHARDRQDESVGKAIFGADIDIEAAIAEIEGRNPELIKTIDRAEAWYTQFMKTWLVDTGMISEDVFNRLRSDYPYYIPTFRSNTSIGEQGQTGISKNSTPKSGLKGAKGGTDNLYNPVMGMVEYVQRYIVNYKHVEVLRAFDDTMRNIQGLEAIAEPAQQDIERVDFHSANENARAAIAEVTQQLQSGKAITSEGEQLLLSALDTLPELGWIMKDTASGKDVLNIPMPDGSVNRWTVYNAPMLTAMLQQPLKQQSTILRAIGAFTGFLSSMATGRNPTFAVQNYASDSATAMVTGSAGGNWFTYIPQQIASAGNLLKNKIADKTGGETDESYKQFMLFGQMGSRYVFRDRNTQGETRRKLYGKSTRAQDVARTIAMSPIIAVENFSDFLEDSTRYNEFRHHDLDTYSQRLLAGKDAREATTDFSKHGSSDKLGMVKAAVPFLGAQMQGLYKTARLFSSENAGKRKQIASRLILDGVVTTLLSTAIRNLSWEDDEKEAYAMLSPYEIAKYWHIKLPDGTFARVKQSQDGIIQFSNALGIFLGNTVTGYEGDVFGDLVAVVGEIAKNAFLNTDTVFKPIIDADNNQTWYGGAIEDYAMEKLPPTERYTDETPEIYKHISGLLNLFGKSYSPLDVEYILSQYTGSFGAIGSGVLGLAAKDNLTGQSFLNMINDHLASKLSVDPVYSNNLSTTFYDGKTKLSQILEEADYGREIAYFRSDLTADEVSAGLQEADALSTGIVAEVYKKNKELWKEHKAILESETMTDAEKDLAAREIRKQINATTLEGNAAIGDFMTKYGYSNNASQNIGNFLSMYNGGKEIGALPTAFELMPQVFLLDEDQPYMQRSKEVWEATGKDSALPHPNLSFSIDGVKYEVEDADEGNFILQYQKAYADYVDKHMVGWDKRSSDEQLDILSSAHTAAGNAAKKWYKKLKRIK